MNLQQLGTCRCNDRDEILPKEGVTSSCESEQVNVNRYTFQSYANGKSAVRVAKEVWFFQLSRCQIVYKKMSQVRPAGPHLWRDGLNQDLQSVHMDQDFCLKFRYLFVTKKRRKLVPVLQLNISLVPSLSESSKLDVPHIFQGDKGSREDELKEPFGPPIMVVHYESCPFSRWQDTKMVKHDHILQRCSITF